MRRIVLVLLICLFAGPAYSNPPSPTPPKASQEKKSHPDQSTQNASSQDGNSNKTPLSVTLDNPVTIQKSDRDRNDDREEGERKASSDWWLVIATWILAGVTLILACITGFLARYTFRLWDATDKLVTGADDTARRQLRAYAMVKRVTLVNVKPDPTRDFFQQWIYFKIKNFGKVPATDIRFTYSICPSEIAFHPNLNGVVETGRIGVIAPGDTWTGHWEIPLSSDNFTNPKIALYVHGRFSYFDGFTPDRLTNFRYMRRGSDDWQRDGDMETCQEGNDAT